MTRIAQEAERAAGATVGHVGTPASRVSPLTRHLSKTVLGLGMVGILGFIPVQKLLPTSGIEAVINAHVITLSAPIDGEVRTSSSLPEFGTPFARGDLLLHITNDRADHLRADDLGYEIQRLNDGRPGIVTRLAEARTRLTNLTEQLRLFTEARTLQLEARQDELKAELAAAQAKNEEAGTTLERFSTLAGKGWTSRAQLNHARRDGSIAEKSQAAAEKRLEAVGVELAAAQRGVFVGIGSNDRPRYMQRVDQLEQQVSNLAETLAERDQRLVRLNEQIALEKARYGLLAAADIVAPTKGRIWEASASQGQHVHRGEELLRVLDCDRPVITAVISEAVYNRLKVGSSARFLPRGGPEELVGQIIRLTRASPSHLAIQPTAATGETYHVIVSVPKLAEGESCLVGRTGRLNLMRAHRRSPRRRRSVPCVNARPESPVRLLRLSARRTQKTFTGIVEYYTLDETHQHFLGRCFRLWLQSDGGFSVNHAEATLFNAAAVSNPAPKPLRRLLGSQAPRRIVLTRPLLRNSDRRVRANAARCGAWPSSATAPT